MRRLVTLLLFAVAALATTVGGQQNARAPIDVFFDELAAEEMRASPNRATATRYFTGEEQDRLERQLTPESTDARRAHIARARDGLARLAKFDRSTFTDMQRVSADLLQWQLQIVADEEPYLDHSFPLEQMNGVNVGLVEYLTVRYPMVTPRNAENYLAVLDQVPTRLGEAISDARRLGARGIVPPRFILQATIGQMRSFVDPTPAENPFITTYVQRMATISDLPEARRSALRAEAERLVATKVYPAWKEGYELLESQLPQSTDDAG